MSVKKEKSLSESDKKFIDTYTERYKADLGINIRNYTKEELLSVVNIKEEESKPKISFFRKILNLLCWKK